MALCNVTCTVHKANYSTNTMISTKLIPYTINHSADHAEASKLMSVRSCIRSKFADTQSWRYYFSNSTISFWVMRQLVNFKF